MALYLSSFCGKFKASMKSYFYGMLCHSKALFYFYSSIIVGDRTCLSHRLTEAYYHMIGWEKKNTYALESSMSDKNMNTQVGNKAISEVIL